MNILKVHNKLVKTAFNKRTDKEVAIKILQSIRNNDQPNMYDVLKLHGIIRPEPHEQKTN
jgi:hypothetical protein